MCYLKTDLAQCFNIRNWRTCIHPAYSNLTYRIKMSKVGCQKEPYFQKSHLSIFLVFLIKVVWKWDIQNHYHTSTSLLFYSIFGYQEALILFLLWNNWAGWNHTEIPVHKCYTQYIVLKQPSSAILEEENSQSIPRSHNAVCRTRLFKKIFIKNP